MLHLCWTVATLFTVTRVGGLSPSPINANHRFFADALTDDLYTLDSNQCSSSLGVSMALSLVYPGADPTTVEQMDAVLRIPEGSQLRLVWNETANTLDAANDGRCQDGGEPCRIELPLLEIANSIWLDDGDSLVPDYEAVVGDFAKQIDFAGDGAGGEVNAWVENNTNGLIDSIIRDGPLAPGVFLLAINSIYLKASWAIPFSEYFTSKDTFYASSSREVVMNNKAHFMHAVDHFEYSHDALPGFQILKLPFNGNSLSMMFVLPTGQEAGLAQSNDVLAALPSLTSTRIAAGLPKFKFESKYSEDLKSSLQSIGLTAPFAGGLCGLVEGKCGFISEIIQKTVIDVHEKGVEAAAVTMVVMFDSAGPEEQEPMLFLADHPFQFFIYDRNEDLILFEGLVVDPVIASDVPEAQLDAVHSDANFWKDTFGVTPEVLLSSDTITLTAAPTESPISKPTTAAPTISPTSKNTTTAPTESPSSGTITTAGALVPVACIALLHVYHLIDFSSLLAFLHP